MNAAITQNRIAHSADGAGTDRMPQPRFNGEWERKRLGDIASIRNQKILPSNVNPNTLCVELDHIGSGNGRLLKYGTAENSTSSKYRFSAGDVLFGRLRSYLRKFWHADKDGICTTEIWPLMVDSEQMDSGFLYAIVQSEKFIALTSVSYGTHMPRTDWGVMRNFEVNLPKIKEQLLTGKTRLPGFSGEWEKISMNRIGSIYGGLTGKSKTDFGGGNARYVTFLGILENVVLDASHTERVYVGRSESQNAVLKDDLLFNSSSETPGDLAIGAVMGEQLDNLYLNSFCFGFRIHDKDRYSSLFLAYLFRGTVGRSIMNALAQGATRYNMSKSQFLALEPPIPACDEQRAIAAVLFDMDAEIAVLERRRDKTRAIKQGMMQQLLTGRVRLVKPNLDFETIVKPETK